MRTTLLGVSLGAVLLAGCGSPATTAPGSAGPANDSSCGPVEICGTATVSGAESLSAPFFSVLSELNNKKCADWAKGGGDTLPLPRVSNSERTVVFFTEPIDYRGPATYSDSDVLKEAQLQINNKRYERGKTGKAEVKVSDDGAGSITLTEWTVEGEDTGAVTFNATWTCTDR